jgi:hypothetical protein
MEKFLELIRDKNNLKRWGIELTVAVVIGIIAGCVTHGLLNKENKGLKVSEELAKSIDDTQVATTGDTPEVKVVEPEEDYSDVVITVVDPSGYAESIKDWSAAEIEAAASERDSYLSSNKYWPAVESYWKDSRAVTGTAIRCTYLFDTSNKVYQASDFLGVPAEVIRVAKNEIYARHGYSFKDTELYNYFMGQVWYTPSVMPADFSEEVFTETEVKNLDLLNSLDTTN